MQSFVDPGKYHIVSSLLSFFPARTECFPGCAFGLSWELLPPIMTNGTLSLSKPTQNQCTFFRPPARLQIYLYSGKVIL